MPGRLKMWAAGQQGIDGSGWDLLDQKTKELQGGRISPVQIFQDKEHGVLLCQFEQDCHQSLQGFLSLALRRQRQESIPIFREGQREQRREKWDRLCEGW